jgi:RNA polymerase sigma-70 factor (ECF subfamily)
MGIDTTGFETWYRAEHPRLLAAMAVVARDTDLAREATAEAFARALERWDRVQEMDSPGGWTYRVALNVLRRRARRATLERRLLLRMAPSPPGSVAVPAHAVEIWEAVTALPPRMRAAVALRYLGGLTEAEVAEAMGVTPGTVASTLHDARRRLAPLLATSDEPTNHGVQATQANHGVQATQANHGVQATQANHGVPATRADRGVRATQVNHGVQATQAEEMTHG